jgi:hypothetical protein
MLTLVANFVKSPSAQQHCPGWVLLAIIAVTIAVSTASCERGFSVMNAIMTRLRARLSQAMLDALMRIKLLSNGIMSHEAILAAVDLFRSAKKRTGEGASYSRSETSF